MDLKKLLLVGVAAGAMAGCGEKEAEDPTPVEETPRTVTIGVRSLRNVDPGRSYHVHSMEYLHNISTPLLDYRPGEAMLDPDGAAELPEMSSDGKVYTFKLRPGMKFADGTALTADSYVRAFQRAKMMQTAGPSVGPSYLVYDYVETAEALDALTLRFTLKSPVAFFDKLTVVDAYYPVNEAFPLDKLFIPPSSPSELLKSYALDQQSVDASKLLGSGAYKIESVTYAEPNPPITKTKTISEIALARNPDYHGAKPAAARVVLKVYEMASAGDAEGKMIEDLKSKQLDIARVLRLSSSVEAAAADENLKVVEAGKQYRRLTINNEDCVDNLDDAGAPIVACPKGVRQALAAALDRSTIITAAFNGRATPAFSPIPPGLWSYSDAFKQKYGDRNLQLAKDLLLAAGYTADKKLKFSIRSVDYPEEHNALKAAFEETGLVEVTIVSEAPSASQIDTWYADFPDPDNFMGDYFLGASSDTHYVGQELIDMIARARVEVDRTARQGLYKQIQALWAEEVPSLPLVHRLEYMAMQKDISAQLGADDHLIFETIKFD